MKRKEPMKRTAFKRKPGSLDAAIKKYHAGEAVDSFKRAALIQKPLKRKKPMGPGKVATTRKRLMKAATDNYFREHGWEDGTRAFDQVTGLVLKREDAKAHHKTPESELRKAGLKVEERNQPEKLIICHWAVHLKWVHNDWQGRPKRTHEFDGEEDAERRFRIVEESPANASNNLCVEWSDQDLLDLNRFLGVKDGI